MIRWFAALALYPALGWAQEAQQYPFRGFVPMQGVEYYCTDRDGARVELGQVICITAGCDTWTARCDMSLNSPMWRRVQDGCPGVSLLDRLEALQPVL